MSRTSPLTFKYLPAESVIRAMREVDKMNLPGRASSLSAASGSSIPRKRNLSTSSVPLRPPPALRPAPPQEAPATAPPAEPPVKDEEEEEEEKEDVSYLGPSNNENREEQEREEKQKLRYICREKGLR
jgi:hypothetical protein